MKLKIVMICLMTIFLQYCYSQQISTYDSLSRYKAQNASNLIADEILNNNYLLFSIGDEWYLIVVEYNNYYKEFYFQLDTSYENRKKSPLKIYKPNNILEKAFNKKLYYKGFINLNSDFYKTGYEISDGNTTYFYLKNKDGIVYGESKLTSLIKPNPINDEVYNFLLKRLLHYITANRGQE